MKTAFLYTIVLSTTLTVSCGNKGLKTICEKKWNDQINLREYTDTTDLGFIVSNNPTEITDKNYLYRIGMFTHMGIEFTGSRFETWYSTCVMKRADYLRSRGRWYFKKDKLVLKCEGPLGKKFRFTLYTFKQANILVPDKKWLEFNTRMHEKPGLVNYLYHYTTGPDSTLLKPFNCLSEVALIRLNKQQ